MYLMHSTYYLCPLPRPNKVAVPTARKWKLPLSAHSPPEQSASTTDSSNEMHHVGSMPLPHQHRHLKQAVVKPDASKEWGHATDNNVPGFPRRLERLEAYAWPLPRASPPTTTTSTSILSNSVGSSAVRA